MDLLSALLPLKILKINHLGQQIQISQHPNVARETNHLTQILETGSDRLKQAAALCSYLF